MENEKNVERNTVRLDEKVKVRSIAPWITGASRKTTMGDVSIPPRGSVLLTREEIIAQAQNGNKLLTGIDGVGGHATWYVEDAFTREELSFDMGAKKQSFLSKESVKKMFDLKTQKAFEENVQRNVVTRAEKAALIDIVKDLGINDYRKIAFCTEYTGFKM